MTIAPSLFLLFLCSTFQDAEEWVAYAPKGAGFAVSLPPGDHPPSDTPFIGPGGAAGTLRQVLVQTDELYYDLKRYQAKRPIARADEKKWIAWARDQEAGFGAHGKLDGEKDVKVGAVSGREFTLRTEPPGVFESRGRAFVKGSTIYVLVASSRKGGQPLPPDADRFLGSFAFGSKPSSAGEDAAKAGEAERAKAEAKIPNTWKPLEIAPKGKATVAIPRGTTQDTMGGNLGTPLDGFFCITRVAETPAAYLAVLVFRSEKGKDVPRSPEALKVAREQAVFPFGTAGRLSADAPIATAAGAGREFALTIERGPKGVVNAKGRAYVDRDAIYLLLAVAKAKGKALPPEADRFLDSLALATPVAAAPADASAPAPPVADPGAMEAYGTPVDPDGDVTFTPTRDALWVEIPGKDKVHLLAPERKLMNAPRALAPATGDFVATVKIDGATRAAGDPAVKGLPMQQSAGLIVWKDARNYLILQRRTTFDGRVMHQVVMEGVVAGRAVVTQRLTSLEKPIDLRLERRGGRILPAMLNGGKDWFELTPVPAAWAKGAVQVGVVAANTSTEPLSVSFGAYSLKK